MTSRERDTPTSHQRAAVAATIVFAVIGSLMAIDALRNYDTRSHLEFLLFDHISRPAYMPGYLVGEIVARLIGDWVRPIMIPAGTVLVAALFWAILSYALCRLALYLVSPVRK